MITTKNDFIRLFEYAYGMNESNEDKKKNQLPADGDFGPLPKDKIYVADRGDEGGYILAMHFTEDEYDDEDIPELEGYEYVIPCVISDGYSYGPGFDLDSLNDLEYVSDLEDVDELELVENLAQLFLPLSYEYKWPSDDKILEEVVDSGASCDVDELKLFRVFDD